LDKKTLSERDICTKFITPAIEKAGKVLEALLEKYADEGVENIESLEVLKVKPLNELGSPIEIIGIFGSREKYLAAVEELERELYRVA